MTPAERRLWRECLSKFPHRVLRQRPIDNFIVDFYCAALRLVIEVDGSVHDSPQAKAYDRHRTQILNSHGLTVIRFHNDEILGDFDRVHKTLHQYATQKPPKIPFPTDNPPIPPSQGG